MLYFDPSNPMDPTDPAFVITCVGWHTQRPGNELVAERFRPVYRTLINFLQDNGLTTRTILPPEAPVADEVAIRVGDLTPDGDLLMRRPYDRWLGKIDHGMDPTDTSILERALKKIRAGKAGPYGE